MALIRFSCLLLGLVCCFACKKEKAIEVAFSTFQLEEDLKVMDIEFITPDSGYLSMGRKYGNGLFYQTTDGGDSWTKVLDQVPEINDFDLLGNQIYLFPWGDKIISSNDQLQSTRNIALPGWTYVNAAEILSDSLGLIIGGNNFNFGVLHAFNPTSGVILSSDSLLHNLSDLAKVDEHSAIIVGFGVILRYSNQNRSFEVDEARGDYYQAIDFGDASTGYVVGDYGSIYKSTDAGRSWKRIRAASTLLNNVRIRDVHFIDANKGMIVGLNGLAWLTENGGESWTPFNNLKGFDFYSVHVFEETAYLGANNGALISVILP